MTTAAEQTAALSFQAVGHYDLGNGNFCVMTVVAAFGYRSDAEAFISRTNDEVGAEELELFIDGEPAPAALTADEFAKTF